MNLYILFERPITKDARATSAIQFVVFSRQKSISKQGRCRVMDKCVECRVNVQSVGQLCTICYDRIEHNKNLLKDKQELLKELIEEYGEDGCSCHPEISKLIKLMKGEES